MTLLLRIGAGSLLCLMPLALYFVFLATLNQRRRPTMLAGRWDYTCLLLGLSGFIVMGGPLIVGAVDSAWRNVWFAGNFSDIKKVWHTNSVIWSVIVVGYVAILILIISIFMSARGRVTQVYNVDAESLSSALVNALQESGAAWREVPGGFEITDRSGQISFGDRKSHTRGDSEFLGVQSFQLLRHASLTWRHNHPGLRQLLERHIDKHLAAVERSGNPAGGWFMSAAVTILVIMVIWMIFLIWMILSKPKGF